MEFSQPDPVSSTGVSNRELSRAAVDFTGREPQNRDLAASAAGASDRSEIAPKSI
jgi:hypothetical protein